MDVTGERAVVGTVVGRGVGGGAEEFVATILRMGRLLGLALPKIGIHSLKKNTKGF